MGTTGGLSPISRNHQPNLFPFGPKPRIPSTTPRPNSHSWILNGTRRGVAKQLALVFFLHENVRNLWPGYSFPLGRHTRVGDVRIGYRTSTEHAPHLLIPPPSSQNLRAPSSSCAKERLEVQKQRAMYPSPTARQSQRYLCS